MMCNPTVQIPLLRRDIRAKVVRPSRPDFSNESLNIVGFPSPLPGSNYDMHMVWHSLSLESGRDGPTPFSVLQDVKPIAVTHSLNYFNKDEETQNKYCKVL
jgi:hypothetical protein